MTTSFGAPFDALHHGQALTIDEVDWEVVGGLLNVDFGEHDDYEYYITERQHPLVFIKGDVKIDGSCHTDDLAAGRDGFDIEGDEWGVVILGDLEVADNLALDELSPIFVTGNLKAGTITNGYGSLVVSGTIESGFVYVITADEGGIVHTTECKTPLFIDAGGTIDSDAPGDYRLLLANGYSPRQKVVLRRALDALGSDSSGMTVTGEMAALGKEADPAKLGKLVELVEELLDSKPDDVPDAAQWDDAYPPGYKLAETDDDGTPHGVEGHWNADGTVKFIKTYQHGTPHGEWTVEANRRLYTQMYENGELQRPEGVPEGSVWLDDEKEWELSQTDEDGKKHGDAKWWGPDGTLVRESSYEHGLVAGAQPQRPEGVPEAAVWLEKESEWELSDTDDEGKKHGDVKWWRPDGSLVCECYYEHGLAQGEGRRFHESGEVSQSYTFVDGKLHGDRVWFATDAHTTERKFHANIAKVVQKNFMGRPGAIAYFDKEGNEVDGYSGRPLTASE